MSAYYDSRESHLPPRPYTHLSTANMKAIIFIDGFGARLRSLTLTLPKPQIEFGNKPMIYHQVEALVAAGVLIVLAVNYRPEIMKKHLAEYKKGFDIDITFSIESEPLSTAGPLKLVEETLLKDDFPFFALNSDVTAAILLRNLLNSTAPTAMMVP